ncbi:SDR family NAD(P)-dependent oxidoreductase [Yinghuangia aomiensis]
MDALADKLAGRWGGVDALVNNAGIISVAPLEALTPKQFTDALDVMFTGPMRLTLALLPGMRARGDARIVTITSIGGRLAPPHLLPYACAKFASTGFSEGLRAELAGSGVAVTTVVPGLMRTGSHRAARFGGRHAAGVRVVLGGGVDAAAVDGRRTRRPRDRACRVPGPTGNRADTGGQSRRPTPRHGPGDYGAPARSSRPDPARYAGKRRSRGPRRPRNRGARRRRTGLVAAPVTTRRACGGALERASAALIAQDNAGP